MAPLHRFALKITSILLLLSRYSNAKSRCEKRLAPTTYPELDVADGWEAHLLVNDLDRPRMIVVDDRGQLLISGSREGIVALLLDEEGCKVEQAVTIVEGGSDYYNHGLALSPDGKTLYASTSSSVYSWSYSSSTLSTTSRKHLITGMSSGGHVTRTLLIPPTSPDLLLISRGSDGNLDSDTRSPSSGRSMIRVFNLTSITSETDYTMGGNLLGWGLRNSVGLASHPTTHSIWSVENSADNLQHLDTDIHIDNPGEELNHHGPPSSWLLSTNAAENFGYPDCFTASNPSTIPGLENAKIGTQFALSPNDTFTNQDCQNTTLYTPPRLTFPAHTAPLGIAFHRNLSAAFIAFHGSWNRPDPVGYELAMVEIDPETGEPVEESTTEKPYKSILKNMELAKCPEACFRPTAVAVGEGGEVWVAGDSTGEVWVLRRREGESGAGSVKMGVMGALVVVGVILWNGV